MIDMDYTVFQCFSAEKVPNTVGQTQTECNGRGRHDLGWNGEEAESRHGALFET